MKKYHIFSLYSMTDKRCIFKDTRVSFSTIEESKSFKFDKKTYILEKIDPVHDQLLSRKELESDNHSYMYLVCSRYGRSNDKIKIHTRYLFVLNSAIFQMHFLQKQNKKLEFYLYRLHKDNETE